MGLVYRRASTATEFRKAFAESQGTTDVSRGGGCDSRVSMEGDTTIFRSCDKNKAGSVMVKVTFGD